MAKPKYIRCYSWSGITYHTEENLKKFLLNGNITRYAYIFHGHDSCEPHYHFLLVSKTNISANYIANSLDSIANLHQNTFCEPLRDKSVMYKYLTHEYENDEKKYIYDDSCIVTNDKNYFLDLESIEDNKAYCILLDIINHTKYRELAKRYGREIIINWNHYDNFAHMIMAQEPTLKSKIVECDEKHLPF